MIHFTLLFFALISFLTVNASKESSNTACGGRFTRSSGIIHTPNYPDKYDYDVHCEWVIEAPVGQIIELTFLDFDVEGIDTTDCDTDKVHVKNGPDNSSPLLGDILCGQSIPEMATTTGRYMFISFTSDFISMGGRGFKASYVTKPAGDNKSCFTNLCGGVIEGTSSCTIQSPSYPSGYDANLNCSWLIKAPSASQTIALEFQALKLAFANSKCAKNNVTFYDGSDMHAPIISESVCDMQESRLKGKVIVSTGSTLFMQLRTAEASKEHSGFNAKFSVLKNGPSVPSHTTLSSAVKTTNTKTASHTTTTTTTSSKTTTIKNNSPKTTTLLSTIKDIKSTTVVPAKSTTELTTISVHANDIATDPAAMSGLVIGIIIGLAVIVFGALVVAFFLWRRKNIRINLRLREEDARSDVNTLISSNDSREFDAYKNGKIVRSSETEHMYQQL